MQRVVEAVLAGDISTVSDLTSRRAKGLAAAIKLGDNDAKGLEKLKEALEDATVHEAKPASARKLVLVEGKKKKVQFFVIREGDTQVVDDIIVR
ncbi:MAG: hypothetical protein AB7O62_10885 [Pirellulales bacterium]